MFGDVPYQVSFIDEVAVVVVVVVVVMVVV